MELCAFDVSDNRSRVLLLKGVESVCRKHDVDSIEPISAERWWLRPEAGNPESAGVDGGLPDIVIDSGKPDIEILRGDRSAFEQCCPHAQEDVPHATAVQSNKELTFSGRKREVFHGRDRGGGVR
jgi:hypothetical protein